MKAKKQTKLQQAQEKEQAAVNQTNKLIAVLGEEGKDMYETLTSIQELFDKIRHVPSHQWLHYEALKEKKLTWKAQTEKIEKFYRNAVYKHVGTGVGGVGLGVGLVTMGPTVAMGTATTFGVASTGTAISTLSGAAASNAALAWLGGGTLATGGGGMVAGQALLALAGPVGWTIAGSTIAASGLLLWKNLSQKQQLENIYLAIYQRIVKSLELAIVELKERINRMKNEQVFLRDAIEEMQTFGFDYDAMTEQEQYTLGSYVNLMHSSTQLLVDPIKGLVPKFSEVDFEDFVAWKERQAKTATCDAFKNVIIYLANSLYKIELDDTSVKLLWKSLRNDENFLKTWNLTEKTFDKAVIGAAIEALHFKYGN
ncbi:hypothetical protein [Streptococcus sp. DD12]|uniref:hypothetical protein n=1 Tax=Streptococcus sp. DD12 TaxID=1777880 RepID=UPI00079A1159|nr:hypothetical protein [Streptococcus sp. DD12]KXT77031.1 hypothetical protein STRDD12_00165 [Streptococcus sp. DD12]